jgi:hypothetical protein
MKFPIADALSFLAVTSFWLLSCSTQPEYQSVAKEEKIQGYGAPLTMDYQAFIKKWFSTRLKDPHSAVYTFSQPQKGYQVKAPRTGFLDPTPANGIAESCRDRRL